MNLPKSLVTAGASLVLMLVGAFGPWAKVLGIVTINGTDDGKDGWIVVSAAGVALLLLIVIALTRRRWLSLIPLLAGGVAAATAAYDISDVNGVGGGRLASAQWGIYLALAGSILLVLSSIGMLAEIRRPTAEPVAPTEPV